VSHRAVGCPLPAHPLAGGAWAKVFGWRRRLSKEAGEPELADTCPWRALVDPVVADVLELHALAGDGPPAAAIAAATPHHLVEGLLLYTRALHHAREGARSRQRARDETADAGAAAVRRLRR